MSRQLAKTQSRDHVRLNLTRPGDPADHTLRQSVDITRVRLPMTLAELSPTPATASILVDTMLHHAAAGVGTPQEACEATAAFLEPLRFQGVELVGNTAQLPDGRTYTVPVMLFNLDSTIEAVYYDAGSGAKRVASYAYHTEGLVTRSPSPPPPAAQPPPAPWRLPSSTASSSSSSSSDVGEMNDSGDSSETSVSSPPPATDSSPLAAADRIDPRVTEGAPSAADAKGAATPMTASASTLAPVPKDAERHRPLHSMWRVDPSGPTVRTRAVPYAGPAYTYLWLRRSALDAMVAADRARTASLRDELASSSSSSSSSDRSAAVVHRRRASEPVLVRVVSHDTQRVADERWEWYGDFVLQTSICAVTQTLLHMVIQRVRAVNTHEPMAQFGDRVFGLRFVILGLPPTP